MLSALRSPSAALVRPSAPFALAGPSRLPFCQPHRNFSSSSLRCRPRPTAPLCSGIDASRPAPRRRPRGVAPLVEHGTAGTEGDAAKDAEAKGKSLLGSWKSLAPSTRIALGMGLATFAVLGILTADKLEATMPSKPSERRSDGSKPKLLSLSVVDRQVASEGEKQV